MRRGHTYRPPLKPPVGAAHINWAKTISQSFVAAWLLNERAGSSAADIGRRQFPLTLTSTTWTENGLQIADSGNSDATVTGVPYSDAFTFWCRMRRTTIDANTRSIASHHTANGSPSDWWLYMGATSYTVDIPWVAGGVLSGSYTWDNAWHTVALTRSGSAGAWSWKVYIDGVFRNSSTPSSNPNTSAHDFHLGPLVPGSSPPGTIYDVAGLHNRELSAGDILEIFENSYGFLLPVRPRVRYSIPGGAAPTFKPAWAVGRNVVLGAGRVA